MPSRSLRLCNHPGCSALTTEGYCPEHKAEHEAKQRERLKQYDKRRGNAQDRGYDSAWMKVRSAYLNTHPLCEKCEEAGRITVAVLVHHIKPIDEGGDRLNGDNLMALCRDCHEITHGRKKGLSV